MASFIFDIIEKRVTEVKKIKRSIHVTLSLDDYRDHELLYYNDKRKRKIRKKLKLPVSTYRDINRI